VKPSERAERYAKDVIAGKVVACKWIKLACKKHIDDIRASKKKDYPFYYDADAGDRVCRFIGLFHHTKGIWASRRELINLEDWQCFFVCCAFGWKRKADKLRRYRRVMLFVPRKNGKSLLAAPIGLYMLTADGEYGAEVYSGATNERQAWEVFKPAKIMANQNADFLEYYGVQVNASNICKTDDFGKFEPIIGKPGDGSSPSCAIIDELHEHPTSYQLDAMLTGMGAREQPMLLMITTAGNNIAGPCYHVVSEIKRNLEGIANDDELFGLLYTVDTEDDWTSQDALKKANPNFGVSIRADFLISALTQAKNNARLQSSFKTKHLNIWYGAKDAFFNMESWNAAGDSSFQLEDYAGQRAYLGVDLASRKDIAAVEILIPLGVDEYVRFGRYYLPESCTTDSANAEYYKTWAEEGWLTLCPGNIIDIHAIKDGIISVCRLLEVVEIAFDPHQATSLVTDLMANNLPVVELVQTVRTFSEPMKTLDSMILSGKIRHNNDPVMRWMMSNVVAKPNYKEELRPEKDRPDNKIDGAVALLLAINRMIANEHGQASGLDIDAILGLK
jgi:phage terminase large subunit-like protein